MSSFTSTVGRFLPKRFTNVNLWAWLGSHDLERNRGIPQPHAQLLSKTWSEWSKTLILVTWNIIKARMRIQEIHDATCTVKQDVGWRAWKEEKCSKACGENKLDEESQSQYSFQQTAHYGGRRIPIFVAATSSKWQQHPYRSVLIESDTFHLAWQLHHESLEFSVRKEQEKRPTGEYTNPNPIPSLNPHSVYTLSLTLKLNIHPLHPPPRCQHLHTWVLLRNSILPTDRARSARPAGPKVTLPFPRQ